MSCSEWKEVRLGDICNIKGGKRLPKGHQLQSKPTNHPYIRIRDLNNKKSLKLDKTFEYISDEAFGNISRYITNKGDILISIVGTIGLIGVVDTSLDNASLTENCVKLIEFVDSNNDFLYYFLTSKLGQNEIRKGTVGAVQAKLPIKNIKDISLQIPPIYEQNKIASILSSLDDKISLSNQMNETLEEIAQTLFKRWFVDFEFPNAEGLPYKSSGGEMVPSELGEIPTGWKVVDLGQLFNVKMGQSPSGSSYNENTNGSVFYQGRTDFNFRFPQNRMYTTEPKRMANKFDVLLSVRAPVGDVNIANEYCCIGRGLAAISYSKKSFLLYTMKNLSNKFQVFENEGTVFGSINKSGLEGLDVVTATDEIVDKFEIITNSIDLKIYKNSEEIESLTKTRDLLLPKLMSGEIRV